MTDNPTTALMRRLRAELRPNPRTIELPLMDALAQGWTMTQLAERLNTEQQPSHVVTTLRRVAQQPAPGVAPAQPSSVRGSLGPCQLSCDHGWLPSLERDDAVVPCPSCRPDTARRNRDYWRARDRGASHATAVHLMTDGGRTMPSTYWRG